MTEEQKNWIDNATYEELLSKWRFDPVGSSWFSGDTGEYYAKIMQEKRSAITDKDKAATSKRIGWDA